MGLSANIKNNIKTILMKKDPIAKYNKRDTNSYLPVRNNFFNVPIIFSLKLMIR